METKPVHEPNPSLSTASDEPVDRTRPARDACVEVLIRWGATVLHVAHLAPPRSFYVGEGGDCFVPAEILGAARAPLVVVDASGAVSVVLARGATGTIEREGASPVAAAEAFEAAAERPCAELASARLVALSRGAKATIAIGGVVFEVSVTTKGRSVAGHFSTNKRGLPFHAASAALHVGALAALAAFGASAPPHPDDGPSAEQIYMIQQYIQAADAKEIEEKEAEEVAEPSADTKVGMTGARAKGEEGSMGSMASVPSSNRYGTAGPSDAGQGRGSSARQEALQSAAEFGMIGLLNSGSGGDPSAPSAPWGSGSSEGSMWGSSIGDAFGAGGQPTAGIGSGGGGRGEGISLGAIGAIGHGAGAPSGQGFGSGAGRVGVGGARAKGGTPSRQPAPTAHIAPPPAAPVVVEAPSEAPIDPNGRFATTYRPGGGHLAAFESAVARGIVPAAEREVVSDIGARYAPTLASAPGKALSMRVDLERRELPPAGGPFHLRIAMRGTPEGAESRPHLSVHLVLDVSGSMAGEPIARAREAAEALVDRLAPTDDFSLVAFSSDAEVKVSDGLVGPRREAIRSVIRGLREQGGTNIAEGLSLAYTQASQRSIPEDAVRVVLLLSDGRATSGDTSSDRITRLSLDAFQKGIQTSAFGLGADYDGALMSSIASDGAGGYYYLRDGEQIAAALSTELDKRLDPVATAVEVRVRLKRDVDLLRVYGSRRLGEAEAARVRAVEVAADRHAAARDHIKEDRHNDNEGGMRFFIPAFARDDSHAFLLKVSAPAGEGPRAIASVELKYKDRVSKKNVVEEVPVSAVYAASDGASAGSVDASVARTVQGFAAGETLTEAAQRIARGDRSGAAAILAEREDILTLAASTLHEPLFLRDASRLARLRSHAGSPSGVGDPLVLSMLLETAGRTHLR